MPVRYRTSRRWGLPPFIYVQWNVSRSGVSRTVAVWPWSYNNRTHRHRINLPWIFWWESSGKKKGGRKRSGRGGGGTAGPPQRGVFRAVFGLPFRLTGRFLRWGAAQTAARSRGYWEEITDPYRVRVGQIKQFGWQPVVIDMTTGEAIPARQWVPPTRPVLVPTPVFPPPTTRPPAVPVGAGQEDPVATSIKNFSDLNDPDIDPHDYAEELPAQMNEVARMLHDHAQAREDQAAVREREAAAMRAYADYMEAAEVDSGIVAQLNDAAETLEAAAQDARRVAAAFSEAAGDVDGAAHSADNVYGDHKPPRFDKAS